MEKPTNNGPSEVCFGLIAFRKGFITQDHLIEALEIQVLEEIEFGTHREVGEILSNRNIMPAYQIEEVLSDISRGLHL